MTNGLSAVIFIPDDTAKFGSAQPLMLQPVLGAPLLTWLTSTLCAEGIGRFFLVCHDRYAAQAKACLPSDAEVMTSADSNPVDQLHVFLSTADDEEQEVTIITGAAAYLPMLKRQNGTRTANACCVSRERLMEALDTDFSFSQFLRENGAILSDNEGFYCIDSPSACLEIATLLRRDQVLRLQEQGVEVFDCDHCYIAPTVRIEPGVKLLPGAMLCGRSLVRAGAVIGPWTRVEDSEIGEDCVVNASQVFASRIPASVYIGPYALIREGISQTAGEPPRQWAATY